MNGSPLAEIQFLYGHKPRKVYSESPSKKHRAALARIRRRRCFICDSRGSCKHREIEVELALMEKIPNKPLDNPSAVHQNELGANVLTMKERRSAKAVLQTVRSTMKICGCCGLAGLLGPCPDCSLQWCAECGACRKHHKAEECPKFELAVDPSDRFLTSNTQPAGGVR